MGVRIFSKPKSLSKEELARMARERFGDMVKGVVDVEREVVALGGELHADGEALLLAEGSQQKNVWGINLYPEREGDEFIEFDSMINIRPSQGNRSRGVEDRNIQEKIKEAVSRILA
jgi:hypothetical protein